MKKATGLVLLMLMVCQVSLFGGVLVNETDGDSLIQEYGVSDVLEISLDSPLAGTAEITISANSPDIEINGGFAGDSTTLVFNTSNWNVPRYVTLVAADDGIQEQQEQVVLSFTVVSSDAAYNGALLDDVVVTVLDKTVEICPEGDIDGDCVVSLTDLAVMAEQWLTYPDCEGAGCADLVEGSRVDLNDFEVIAQKWNKAVGPVVINEFMAENSSDYPYIDPEDWEVFDETGDNVDWIELWNISDESVRMDGWYLTDDRDDMMKWEFPEGVVLGAGSYMLIYASGNAHVSGSYIHTNFSLGSGGEYLALVNDNGLVVSEYSEYEYDSDKYGYPPQESNVSYGYTDYMQSQRYFYPATPGRENNNVSLGTAPDTKFSVDRGFFTEPFELNIYTENPEATVRYTLDGSTPDWGNGEVFEPGSTITIDKTTVLRARSFLPGYMSSNVDTQTYIFVADVATQQPTGARPGSNWPYPGYPINNQRFDYGMDPDVVNSAQYSDLIDDALLAVPTMSMVIDSEYLFDSSTGIYVNADAARSDNDFWTLEKEKACSLELLNPDGSDGFNINCGVRIRGGASRSSYNPKHAFRFFFRSKYGKGKLEYPLFGDEGVDEFDKVDLRTSQNFSWAFKGTGDNFYNTMIREVFSRDMQGELGDPYTKSRYYHLYINGVYWGLYQTQERAESRFAASYLGGQKEDYDVIKADWNVGRNMVATEGNNEAFSRLWAAVVDGVYTTEEYYRLQGMNVDGSRNPEYERLLDVQNLIDYQLINYYTSDTDGAASRFSDIPNNIFCIYNRNNPDGWKWLEHDSEHSLGVSELWWPHYENLVTPFTTAGAQERYFNPHWMHEQLIQQNSEYRVAFADRVQELFYNGGLFTADSVWALLMERASQIETAIIAESARWGDANTNPPRTRDTWYQSLQYLNDFIYGASGYNWDAKPREQRVLAQFDGVNWLPKISAPGFNQYGGYVSNDFDLRMSNPNGAGQIYYTTDGTDPRLPVDDSQSESNIVFISESAAKKVTVPSGEFGVVNTDMSLLAETWTGIGGVLVTDLTNNWRYPDQPDSRVIWSDFEMPQIDYSDSYGTRVRGYLYPPSNGWYQFWITSDDYSELLLSTDASPGNASVIAQVPGWSNRYEWYKYSEQESTTIYLRSDRRYYIEALQKEDGGGDNLAIAWSGPTINGPSVVESRYLLPSGQPWTAVEFNDSSWISGNNAVGYDRDASGSYHSYLSDGINVESSVYNVNTSCYVRIPFNYSGDALSSLRLDMRYEDGVVVFLNGIEVVRDNVNDNGALSWDSYATNGRDDGLAVVPVSFDLSDYIDFLVNGENVLAIQVMNNVVASSDMLLTVKLTGSGWLTPPGAISNAAVLYDGPVSVDKAMEVKARVFDGMQWSALSKGKFALDSVVEGLRVTEIMYHAEDPNTDYVELKNIGTGPINLSGVRFTKGMDYDFGDLVVPAGGYILLVEDAAGFEAKYGSGLPVVGEYTGNLSNGGDKVRIKDLLDNTLLEFEYKDSWYEITDGEGFSLCVRDENTLDQSLLSSKDGWRPSAVKGGSPGAAESVVLPIIGDIVINEVLAHSHATSPDWIELHNTTAESINIGGWFLSDDNADDAAKKKYEIPLGTTIAGGGYVVFYQDMHFGNAAAEGCHDPFGLSEGGDVVYLHSGDNGVLTGYVVEEDFGASASNVSFGRYYKESTDSTNFVAMAGITPGEANTYPKVGPIVISEIMYNPGSGGSYDNDEYEYIELTNITGAIVNLWEYDELLGVSVGWKISDGVEYEFGISDYIEPYSSIVIVKNLDAFAERYPAVAAGKIYGPYDGKLSNGGEKVELVMPGDSEQGERYYIRVDRVGYEDSLPWPVEADGDGESLNRIELDGYGNDVANWYAGAETPGN